MEQGYSIAYIERSTGISRETLRIWERRYGFPAPARDPAGDRTYSMDDLERLRVIKRLLDQGRRPGKVVPLARADLDVLDASVPPPQVAGDVRAHHAEFLELLRQPLPDAAQDWLKRRLSNQGLAMFVLETLGPLIDAVGDAWAVGQVSIHEEHLFSEQVQRLMRKTLSNLPAGDRPRILLTTLPEELHSLGLLMAEAMFALEGARCLSLGVNTPTPEIIAAVRHHQVDVLALSFSLAYPRRRIAPQMEALRAQLPAGCQIWAGGKITARLRAMQGVRYCPKLHDAGKLLRQWHAATEA